MELIDRAQLVVQDRVEKMIAEGTAEQLALTFTGMGIQAICGNPNRCAIAVYLMGELTAELGEEASKLYLAVPGGEAMDHVDVCCSHDHISRRTRFPSFGPLGDFASRFDREAYPALIEPDSLEGRGKY
jgi:hypothetical protein